jgi:hypothetical protein
MIQKYEAENGAMDEGEEEEEFGVFNPSIDQILWRRLRRDGSGEYEYLVKLKDYSYLHCEWIKGDEVASLGRGGKNKLNRFNKQFDQQIIEKEIDPEREEEYFDPSYVKVDKILSTAEIFPVIHSKKANEIKGKWSELLSRLVSKLLNYSKDNVHYGVCFMEPVNPDRDNCPDYKNIVKHPMDLGTLANRLYLDCYKSSAEVLKDLGLVFKNCRLYNRNESSDVRVVGDTLREYAKILYKQWHNYQSEKYKAIQRESSQRQEEYLAAHPEEKDVITGTLRDEVNQFTERLFAILDKGMEAMEKAEVERADREALRTYKAQCINDISCNTVLFGQDDIFVTQLITDISKVFSFVLGLDLAKQELHRIKLAIKERIAVNVEHLALTRLESEVISRLNLMTFEEQRNYDPGEFNYNWLKDSNEEIDPGEEEFMYFEDEEILRVDILAEPERVYLVKWMNLSYLDTTWEVESVIDSPTHIQEFKTFNRTLDKETRHLYTDQLARHRHLLDLMNNPKKKAKTPYQTINDYKNKLYHLDVSKREQLFQYTAKNQPIFKHK